MIRNNLKIAWRYLLKDRQFTFLNVLGLSAGLACTFLIYLWVNDELSIDKFNEKDSQLYQVMEYRKMDGQMKLSDESSGLMSEILASRMPEVKYATSVAPSDWWQKFTLSSGDNNIKATGQYVGKDYFNIFSFKLIDGKKSDVLTDKNSIVISDELARKLFGTTENVIGKSIKFQHERDFFVSGIFEKVPVHSTQQFDFVLSFDYLYDIQSWVKTWNNTGPHNFILVRKGTNIKALNRQLADVIRKSCGDSTRTAFATRFSDNYLQNTFSHGTRVAGNMEYVQLFSLIALFILGIACINFMNLSTAKASRRLKEVGIKKVVGAGRKQLMYQFLTETLLLTLFAMVLAVGMAWILLPQFNSLTGKQIELNFSAGQIAVIAGITMITGLLAGSYPALYLSGFNPIKILKGKFQSSFAETFSRKGLVVFQFVLSIMLIVAVLVVYRQIQMIQKTKPGYNQENIVRFYSEGKILGKEDVFIGGLKKLPGIVNASYTWHEMIGRNYGDYSMEWDGKDPLEKDYIEGFGGGYDFIETMGMQMKEGRSYSTSYGDENSKIVLNEAAVKLMHMKDPVGKTVRYGDQNRQIIGIVKDFHFESLHEPVKPCFISLAGLGNSWSRIMVRIKAEQQNETIAAIRKYYQSFNPGFPFDFNFLDEAYQKQYLSETRIGILSRCFAGLAILISCLGLFGLAAFTAQKRQKEIGIRKVVGATVPGIAAMLSRDFLQLILIALLIAFPVSWWAMNRWLEGFAYRVHIGAGIFIIAGTAVVLITLITISYQAIKAAMANPIKSLRSE